jgi:hypothetical protein
MKTLKMMVGVFIDWRERDAKAVQNVDLACQRGSVV